MKRSYTIKDQYGYNVEFQIVADDERAFLAFEFRIKVAKYIIDFYSDVRTAKQSLIAAEEILTKHLEYIEPEIRQQITE